MTQSTELRVASGSQAAIAELPDTLHELLGVAIKDMSGLNRRLYRPSASVWHAGDDHHCLVCLGGAVMAGSLRVGHSEHRDVSEFPRRVSKKLIALDVLRGGSLPLADSDEPNAVLINQRRRDFSDANRDLLERCRHAGRFINWRDWDRVSLPAYRELHAELRRAGL